MPGRVLKTLGATLLAAMLLMTPIGCGDEEPVPPAPRDGQDSSQQDQDRSFDEPALPDDDDDLGNWGRNE